MNAKYLTRKVTIDRAGLSRLLARITSQEATDGAEAGGKKTRFVRFGGETIPVAELAERSGVRYTTLLYRLDHGCPSDRLLDAPDTTRRFTTS